MEQSMCLIVLGINQHPRYKLVLAGNRDEYYDRPSSPPSFWEAAPHILAGKDLKGGGTWLGITRSGRLAAVTNYRDPSSVKSNALSRGWLVRDYLISQDDPVSYLKRVRKDGARYNGFNLIVGHKEEIFWYSNRGESIVSLSTGCYGVSNSLLDTPWPKVVQSKERISEILSDHKQPSPERLFQFLADRTQAPDHMLPDTGVGVEWERILSPVFISSPTYGTRSSTLIFIDEDERVTFMDRTFNSHPGAFASISYEFMIEPLPSNASITA
jgi:uncharacterized protein with NRDE domain